MRHLKRRIKGFRTALLFNDFCYDFWMANALAKGNELVIKQGKSEIKHSLIGLSKALQE